jgi:hypothetical protein
VQLLHMSLGRVYLFGMPYFDFSRRFVNENASDNFQAILERMDAALAVAFGRSPAAKPEAILECRRVKFSRLEDSSMASKHRLIS